MGAGRHVRGRPGGAEGVQATVQPGAHLNEGAAAVGLGDGGLWSLNLSGEPSCFDVGRRVLSMDRLIISLLSF